MESEELVLLGENQILKHTIFIIGEILVDQSKQHITEKQALEEIRNCLRKCNYTLQEEL